MLADLQRRVSACKKKLGMLDTPAEVEAMRNPGDRRTPEKHELLRRIAVRVQASRSLKNSTDS